MTIQLPSTEINSTDGKTNPENLPKIPRTKKRIVNDKVELEEALEYADAVFAKQTRGRHLSEIQQAILRCAWQRLNYEEIAYINNYDVVSIEKIFAARLWQIFKEAFGKPVNKKNFRAVITSQVRKKKASIAAGTTQYIEVHKKPVTSVNANYNSSNSLPEIKQTHEILDVNSHKNSQDDSDNPLANQIESNIQASILKPQIWTHKYRLDEHTGLVNSLVISPDSKFLVSGSQDKTVKVWDLETGDYVCNLGNWLDKKHTESVSFVAMSADGQIVASASHDRTVKIWDFNTRKLLQTYRHSGVVYSVAISPDGQYIVCGCADSIIYIWNLKNKGASDERISRHFGAINSVCFSPNGQIFASGSDDKTINMWYFNNNTLDTKLPYSQPLMSVAFSANGKLIVSSHRDNTISVMNLSSKQLIYSPFRGQVFALNPNRNTIAIAHEQTIEIYDLYSREKLSTIKERLGNVLTLGFSPNGRTLASTHNNIIKIWHLQET